jgi:hypothetical protein
LTSPGRLIYRLGMRARRAALVLAIASMGCQPKPKPQPQHPTPPPPPPKGELLRWKAKTGDAISAAVKLVFETDIELSAGKKAGIKHAVFNYHFTDEEKIGEVASDGTATISTRLVDVAGSATGVSQEYTDDFALALDELKISFKRSPRGEVSALAITGVRKPLDEAIAFGVAQTLYLSGLGPILPEKNVEEKATWQADAPLPEKATGKFTVASGYTKKEGPLATVTVEANLQADRPNGSVTQKLTGKLNTELQLALEAGNFVHLVSDVLRQSDLLLSGQATPTAGAKHHFHADWTRKQ